MWDYLNMKKKKAVDLKGAYYLFVTDTVYESDTLSMLPSSGILHLDHLERMCLRATGHAHTKRNINKNINIYMLTSHIWIRKNVLA